LGTNRHEQCIDASRPAAVRSRTSHCRPRRRPPGSCFDSRRFSWSSGPPTKGGSVVARVAETMSRRPWLAYYPPGVPPHLDYPAEPVHWLLEEAARRDPSRVACRFFRQEMTYDQLLAQSRRMAAALRARGLKPGDRVAILLPNTPEYLVAL